MKSSYIDSLPHTTFEWKYHIVSPLKFGRKEIYGTLIRKIGMIFRELCKRKDVKVINVSRSHTYVLKYSTWIECIIIYGIFKRKEYINNVWKVCKSEVQVWK